MASWSFRKDNIKNMRKLSKTLEIAAYGNDVEMLDCKQSSPPLSTGVLHHPKPCVFLLLLCVFTTVLKNVYSIIFYIKI